ncbi:nitroreductase family protein [Natronoflexus pectinivorans]|uniref:Nitroreductase n=1 Tax=Natronoflexus pectinivorans TaxID=682526 RepID=A0A4R2GJ70_9BACT|nr:nitroreductase family protein [Natronoflexus pectinivorans]TCO08769.1 nitroreductase [Natronoflexus pectinivorans]
MKVMDVFRKRESVRSYKSELVSEKELLEILEAGRIAPSAVNFQPWRFIVIDDPELLKEVNKAYPREWFKTAPQVIIVCGNHDESWKRKLDNKDHCDIDVAIAIDHMTLAAAEKGIGTCWVCNFNPTIIRDVLNLPQELEPVALLPVGYPDNPAQAEVKMRKPLSKIAFRNSLNNPFQI